MIKVFILVTRIESFSRPGWLLHMGVLGENQGTPLDWFHCLSEYVSKQSPQFKVPNRFIQNEQREMNWIGG